MQAADELRHVSKPRTSANSPLHKRARITGARGTYDTPHTTKHYPAPPVPSAKRVRVLLLHSTSLPLEGVG